MLNNKKIQVMTKLSLMEKEKEKFEIRNYYMTDYIRHNLLKVIVRVTVGYALILALLAIYHAEYIIASAVKLNYRQLGEYAIGIYLLLLALYSVGSLLGYSLKYRKAWRYVNKYEKGLSMLRKIYQNESEHK